MNRSTKFDAFVRLEQETGGALSLAKMAKKLGVAKGTTHRYRMRLRQIKKEEPATVRVSLILPKKLEKAFRRVCVAKKKSCAAMIRELIRRAVIRHQQTKANES